MMRKQWLEYSWCTVRSVMEANSPDPRYAPFLTDGSVWAHGQAATVSRGNMLALAVCSITVVPLKLIGALICLTTFYTICRLVSSICQAISETDFVPFCGKLACRACLFCLGFIHIQLGPS